MLDLDATVYALDATTVELCLSLFDWASVYPERAAIKLHTLLDLRGAIPAFVYISDAKFNEISVLDFLPVESGSFYVMGSRLSGLPAFIHHASSGGLFRDPR